jgi:hypothetical protein
MKRFRRKLHTLSRPSLTLTLLSSLLVGSALFALADTEPNNTFATREILANGTTSLSGTLAGDPIDFSVADIILRDTITAGAVTSGIVNGQTPGRFMAIYLDNEVGNGVPDTLLRTLDENGVERGFNDDGSPLGDGFASGFVDNVNADGTIRYEITGWPDFDFDGSHDDEGDVDTYIKFIESDVDYYSLGGLAPGSAFTAEIVGGPIDSMLGQFDDAGNLVAVDDDSGAGVLSLLTGNVSSNGVLYLAVSAFADFGFNGSHLDRGDYDLRLTVQAVPEPGSIALGIAGCFALAGLARRRRK